MNFIYFLYSSSLGAFGELVIHISARITHLTVGALEDGRFGSPLQNNTHASHRHLAGGPLPCFQMWFVFKTLQTSSVVHVSMTSKPVWQKQKPSEQWVDMIDYVLRVSSGALGVVYT